MSLIYSTTPFTIDGQNDIPAEAPRSRGMDDTAAQAVIDGASDALAVMFHLHLDLVGSTLTVELDNVVDGTEVYLDYGDGTGETVIAPVTVADTTAATHDYLTDGVYTVAAYTRTGTPEMAQQQVAVNWP